MINKISLYKKIKIFGEFKKTIRLNEVELEQIFGARIDKAYRIYNVLNIPAEMVGEPYNLRSSDIDKISEKSIREYSIRISEYLDSKGLKEMYDFYEIKKVDKYSYLVVLGFSLTKDPFRSNRYYDNIKYRLIPSISIISIILLLILLFL
jgi:hypothetical protein